MSAAFIAESFAVRTSAHLLHLASTSYAQHVALNEFYDSLLPLVDRFAEVCQGLKGRIKRYPEVCPDDQDNPIALLDDYLDAIHDEMKSTTAQSLLNILAELEELTAQTLYKLKFLS